MNREKILNFVGVGLLGAVYLYSLVHVLTYRGESQAAEPGETAAEIKIRFAHWQLEGGVRDAFDALAREYERLHPGVEIEQMAIPEKITKNWSRTQLIGGTAPDLIQLGIPMGVDVRSNTDVLARFFVPLTTYTEQPNPYNEGTDLAGRPWRDTFLDALTRDPNYSENLLDVYGIPNTMFTIRMFYNRDLMVAITGEDVAPKTYGEFIELCKTTVAYRNASGQRVIPVAGSQYNATPILDGLFQSQTQRLTVRLDELGALIPDSASIGLGMLAGRWSYASPGTRSGLELMRETGQFMQPGFMSLGRDDALFYFAQARALMIATGSWDSTSLRAQVEFPIGVFALPIPSAQDPHYAPFMFGDPSEAALSTSLSFGLTAGSPNPGAAVDFLRFLTSKKSNAEFSRISGWLPAVVGLEIAPEIKAFEPRTDGYINGFTPNLAIGADAKRVYDTNLHRLVSPTGTVAAFATELDREMPAAIVSDLQRRYTASERVTASKDVPISAYRQLAGRGEAGAADRLSELLESQNNQEATNAYLRSELNRLGHPTPE